MTRSLLTVWLCIPALVLYQGCRAPQARPAPVPLERQVAGCYALEIGAWQVNPEFGVNSLVEMPPRIHLSPVRTAWSSSSQTDSLPFRGARSLLGGGRAAYLFSYWQRSGSGADTIRVSGDSPPFSIVDLRLGRRGANFGGEIHIRRYFPDRAEHPLVATAAVVARRVVCPEP